MHRPGPGACCCRCAEETGRLLCCERCENNFHLRCVGLQFAPPVGWRCADCPPAEAAPAPPPQGKGKKAVEVYVFELEEE